MTPIDLRSTLDAIEKAERQRRQTINRTINTGLLSLAVIVLTLIILL